MGYVAEQAVDKHTGERWRRIRDGSKRPAENGSLVGTQTGQAQILRVRNTCVCLGLFLLPLSLTKVPDKLQQVAAVRGDDSSGQT